MGYYFVSLVYENMRSDGCRFNTYGESIIKVARGTFLECPNLLPETATYRNMVQRLV